MDSNDESTHFRIRIRGVMSDRLLSAFPEMRARMREHETELMGELPDQSALHGVLGRIEALGLELLEVRRPRVRAGTSVHAAGTEPKTLRAADRT